MKRYEGQPFAILGVNTDDDKDTFRQSLVDYGITWRSAWQGSTRGPIPTQWGVDAYPTVFVLDAKHVIRAIGARGESLNKVVAELMAELELP